MKTTKQIVMLAALLAAFAVGSGPASAKETSKALSLARELNQAFIEVADNASPSVVVIRVAHKPEFSAANENGNPFLEMLPPQLRKQFEQRFRDDAKPEPRRRSQKPVFDGEGSGIVIRADGYIITNGHVVEGADRIQVRFKDGKEYDAEVRGVDTQSDIAVVKIKAQDLPTAKFADSDKVKVGEFAIAIGAPFELDYSVTFGHVSAKGRNRIIPDPSMDQDFIQTDASINPGNSGGPLVNLDGEIIGINTLIRGLHTGIGFAIPSNLAKEVADKLIADGKFTRAWLGIEIRGLREDKEYRDMVKGVEDGVVVRGIVRDGPAAKSDLKLGDVITTVDGHPVATAQELRHEIRSREIGSSVALNVVRNGENVKIKVRPEEWPDDATPAAGKTGNNSGGSAESADLGVTVKPLTKELAKENGLEATNGLVITGVQADSLAARKGLQTGDVITGINQHPVSTLRDYRSAVKDADVNQGVLVDFVREGVSRMVVLKDNGE
jgi:serine protease Do